eukprot:8287682-Lingulodinium_polyedra.AAC.1
MATAVGRQRMAWQLLHRTLSAQLQVAHNLRGPAPRFVPRQPPPLPWALKAKRAPAIAARVAQMRGNVAVARGLATARA